MEPFATSIDVCFGVEKINTNGAVLGFHISLRLRIQCELGSELLGDFFKIGRVVPVDQSIA